MSYDPRPGARGYGAPRAGDDEDGRRGGSVRAARERLQAAQMRTQLPDTSKIIGLPQRPNQLVSQYSTQNKYDEPQQSTMGDDRDNDTVSPPPQWPLPNNANDMMESSPVIPPRSPKRLQPPQQQSIRPVSDEYPIQQLSPGYPPQASPNYLQPPSPEYGVSYSNDELFSPSSYRSSRPLTQSSGISETSSLGSIPDFPVPQPPMPVQQSRRMQSLGPPPSSRRGPSFYYTQMSYVSPIAEESETRSDAMKSRHGSYASSNVFPTRVDDFYPDDDLSDDDETITSERGTISPSDPDDRRGLVKEQPALVRQASLGRRTKPSLMTIKSVDSFGEKRNGAAKKKTEEAALGAGAIGVGATMLAARTGKSSDSRTSTLRSGTAYMDPSSSSSSDSLDTIKNLKSKAGMIAPTHPLQQDARPTTLADRVGMRRPPRLDVDAVRDAEARGSLTSLPDLIRRATRLAANLDRGKTASRLGLDFWEAGAPEKNTRQSGLSDMLAAFPPPGQDTPLRSGTPNAANNRLSKWPSGGIQSRTGMTDSGLSNEKSSKRRRCCGMPMWTFVTLLIVLLFIIAAAVVIPVVLIVIPNQNKSNNSAAQDTQGTTRPTSTNVPSLPAPTANPGADQCDGVITCQNGGVAILNSDRSCNCVCINGFTGRTCTNNDATGCTTTSLEGAANNATMGSGIPRLIESANNDFNVPLNANQILSIFSNLSLSCAAENALITFNGLASRSLPQYLQAVNVKNILQPTRTLPLLDHPHPDPVEKRQTVGEVEEIADERKSTQANTKQTAPVSSNVTALDFARIGVLFALQQTGELNSAAAAQEAIQNFLTNDRNGNSPSSTINTKAFQLDLVDLTIQFRNGTTIRANPPTSSSGSS
ncbi:hypothetical protein IQ07DRAFT_607117 [Pyrenochaeta sp. DS3sAY3a]|nr:hypothetical protein IQ07DRAFT_607117 [Pyrenochaeta sp. DS3sAY3a]